MTEQPPPPDPWKSFRGVMAGTLILEAIVVLLALPVVARADGGLTAFRGGFLIGFAVVLLLLAGVQGRPWAIWVNLAMQFVLIAGFVVDGAVGFIGGSSSPCGGSSPICAPRCCAGRNADSFLGSSRGPIRLTSVTEPTERTLVLIKPDGVERRLVGEILSRIESKGLTFAALELKDVSDDLARKHYAEHEDKPFFGSLLEFITSGPVVAAIVQGPRAVAAFRQIAGGTDPVEKAVPGTIRGDLALITQDNLVHGSDSPESAAREIKLWFPGL